MTKRAKHKISLEGSPETVNFFHKTLFGSVRSKVLQKLLLIWFHISSWSKKNPIRQQIVKRLEAQGLPPDRVNIAYELKPGEVMTIIGCSKRTALEYIQVLRTLRG